MENWGSRWNSFDKKGGTKESINNLHFISTAASNIILEKNKLLKTKTTLSQGWQVSLEIQPTGTVSRYANILHATIGGNHGKHGDRIPAIFFHAGSTKLVICTSLNNNPNNCSRISPSLPINTWNTLLVQQIQDKQDNEYHFKVSDLLSFAFP